MIQKEILSCRISASGFQPLTTQPRVLTLAHKATFMNQMYSTTQEPVSAPHLFSWTCMSADELKTAFQPFDESLKS